MEPFTMPNAGPERFWHVKHQPERAKVLRIELRQKLPSVVGRPARPTLSHLIGWTNSEATDEAVEKACRDLAQRSGRALEFLGVFDNADQ